MVDSQLKYKDLEDIKSSRLFCIFAISRKLLESTMAADEAVYTFASGNNTIYTIIWGGTGKNIDAEIKNAFSKENKIAGVVVDASIYNYCKSILTNRLPKSQTGKVFTLIIKCTKAITTQPVNATINCVVNGEANPLV